MNGLHEVIVWLSALLQPYEFEVWVFAFCCSVFDAVVFMKAHPDNAVPRVNKSTQLAKQLEYERDCDRRAQAGHIWTWVEIKRQEKKQEEATHRKKVEEALEDIYRRAVERSQEFEVELT